MKLRDNNVFKIVLLMFLNTQLFSDCSYELFTINSAKTVKIEDFIDQLSDQCELSTIVSDSFARKKLQAKLGKINLKNLTLEEVLNIILIENNLSYELKNNLLKISYLQTKIFAIDYILSQRVGKGSTDITLSSSNTLAGDASTDSSTGNTSGVDASNSAGSSAQSGIKIQTSDEVKFWEDLDLELQKILNRPQDEYKAQKPIINKNAGLITATATAKQIKRIQDYLTKIQNKVKLQVLIDVQLLVVTMTEGKTTGIDWKQLYALQNVTFEANIGGGKYTSETASYNPSSYFTLKAGGSLQEVIKFLQTQGDVNSISNPKVLTLNNQPALITVGTEYFYKTQQSTSQQGSSGGVAATTQNESVQSVFAGVLLDITPEISNDNYITLKVNPSLSETRIDMSSQTSTDRVMPPDLSRRQLSSVVTVKDGNRIILGGLINSRKTQEVNKVPILGDIPGLSYLFRREENSKQVEELVIVIEPHIIHKDKNNLSLSDLGFKGFKNSLLTSKIIRNETNIQNDSLPAYSREVK